MSGDETKQPESEAALAQLDSLLAAVARHLAHREDYREALELLDGALGDPWNALELRQLSFMCLAESRRGDNGLLNACAHLPDLRPGEALGPIMGPALFRSFGHKVGNQVYDGPKAIPVQYRSGLRQRVEIAVIHADNYGLTRERLSPRPVSHKVSRQNGLEPAVVQKTHMFLEIRGIDPPFVISRSNFVVHEDGDVAHS